MLTSRDLAFAGMIAFAFLFTLDAWTTELGLMRGAQEMAPLASAIIFSFGIRGFVALKLSISVVSIATALLFFRGWRGLGEISRWTYSVASISLIGSALVPVVHNLILLGFL